MKFRVWSAGEDRPDTGPNQEAVTVTEAAARWMEYHWADNDHPESLDLIVEAAESGDQYRYTATATQDVTFSAKPTEPALIDVERAVANVKALRVSAIDGAPYVNRDSVIAALRNFGRRP